MHENQRNSLKQDARTMFSATMERARRAMGYVDHIAAGFDTPHAARMQIPAATSLSLNLSDPNVQVQLPTVPGFVHGIDPSRDFKTYSVNAAIAAGSRVAQAGARVVVAAAKPGPSFGAEPVFYRDAGLFRVIEPATFATVADGAEATISAMPYTDDAIAWDMAPSVAFRTQFTRSMRHSVGGSPELENDLLYSIISGLGLAVDSLLLTAIAAKTLQPFSLGAASARGLLFNELFAFAGTAGNGVAVDANGSLRVSGIKAELSRSVAESIIGSFPRAAVAIRPEINIHFKRMDIMGAVDVTVFASMTAHVPDSTAFWKVTA